MKNTDSTTIFGLQPTYIKTYADIYTVDLHFIDTQTQTS